ncbi:uncharacterized protein BDFB_007133 [Asbolus verrucosus]|uniref:7tm 7 domain containing protein n=1 Tax=Asbolus verrucosus TaxID=1661398 RepID=A0A482VDY1_ASBVE|nr:uncharacterized protein BDFB_007133 [Asbolus verrucosus]
MILILTPSYINYNTVTESSEKFLRVDTELIKLGQEESIKKSGQQTRKSAIILIVVIDLIFNILGAICSAMTKKNDRVSYFIINCYPRLVSSTTNIHFFVFTILIETRFRMINDLISKKILDSKNHTEKNVCENINQIVNLHENLTKICTELNAAFSLHLLLWISINFILMVGDMYILIYTLLFGLYHQHSKIFFILLKNLTMYMFDFFFYCKRSTNRTKTLVLGIKIDIEKEEERDVISESTLRLMKKPLKITAFKLFTIDNALLYSVKGRVVYSKFGLLQTAIYFAAFIALSICFSKVHTTSTHEDFSTFRTVAFVIIFRSVANITVMIMIFIDSRFKMRKFIGEINKMIKTESEFTQLENEYVHKTNYQNRGTLIRVGVVVHILFGIVGSIISVYSRHVKSIENEIFGFVILAYPKMVVSNINMMIYLISMTIQSRFGVINKILSRYIDESKKIQKFPRDFNFCAKIKHLVALHKNLIRTATEINSIFGPHLLLWTTINFVLLVGDLYIAMHILLFHRSHHHYLALTNLLKNIAMYIFDLYYFSKKFTDLCYEANRTKNLLVGIRIDIYKEEERDAVISGALKLIHSELKMTACKFFNINNELLFSICGAASSYLFIMIQLDMGNQQNHQNATISTNMTNTTFICLEMRNLTTKEILAPLTILSRILGTVPYKFHNGDVIFCKKAILQSLTTLTLLLLITIYYFTNMPTRMHDDVASIKTVSFVILFRGIGTVVVTVLIVIANSVTYRKVVMLLRKIYQIDAALIKLGQAEYIAKTGHQKRKLLIILVIVFDLIFVLFGSTVSLLFTHSNRVEYFIILAYPKLVVNNMSMFYCMVIMIVQERFKAINSIFLEKLVESRKNKKYPLETNFSATVEHLASLHKNLIKISKELNSNFSLHLLLSITTNFVSLVGDLYISTYILFFATFSKCYKLFIVAFKNVIIDSFDLFYFSKISSRLCYEANRTKCLLAAIKLNIDKEDERNTVITAVLQMMQNKLEITACNLFKIDNALLFSKFLLKMCGAATSYLFIMIQMDIGSHQNRQNATKLRTCGAHKMVTNKQTLAPIFILSTIMGIISFKIQNEKVIFCKRKILLNSIVLIIFAIFSVNYYKHPSDHLPQDLARTHSLLFITTLRGIGAMVVTVLIFGIVCFNCKKIMREIERISVIDSSLIELGQGESISKSNCQSRRILIILIVVVDLIFEIFGNILTAVFKPKHKIYFFVVVVYPRLVINCMNITFWTITVMIQERFRIINGIIATYEHPFGSKFCDDVQNFASMHQILIKITRNINSIFSLHLLIWISISFVFFVVDLYMSTYLIFTKLYSRFYPLYFYLINNLMMYAFDLCYFARRSTKLCLEANRTKTVLVSFQLNFDKEDERNEVILAALQLMRNNLNITACKLFNINHALLYSIWGGAFSYLFIMIQLDIGSAQRINTGTNISLTG